MIQRRLSPATIGTVLPSRGRGAGAEIPAVRPPVVHRFWEPPLPVTIVFLVFVMARYMQWGARRDILAKIRVEFLLGLVLVGICVALLPAHPIRIGGNKDVRNVLVGIVALFFAMIIQVPFAADPVLARKIFWDRVIKFAMLTLFMVALIRSPKILRWFLAAFLVSCFYITQESVRGLITGGLVWQNQGIMRLHGAVPIYRHPNSLGGLAMGTIPFVIFLFPTIRRWRYRLLLVPLLITSLVCVIYSGSRTAYVALLTFIVFWWSQSRHKVRNMVVGLMVGAALVPLIPDQYIQRFESIEGHEAEGNSKEMRIQILKDAWAIFLDNPLGIGVASFPAVRQKRFKRSQDTHNLYLEVGTNLGVQGLVVFLAFLLALWRSLRHSMQRFHRLELLARHRARAAPRASPMRRIWHRWAEELYFLEGVARATLAFLVVRLVLGIFGMDLYEVYWWFMAGMAIVCSLLSARLTVLLAPADGDSLATP